MTTSSSGPRSGSGAAVAASLGAAALGTETDGSLVCPGSINGIMRAYAAADGKIIWEYNAAHEYSTVNGVAAKGGAINGPGPTIAGGMLFMTSGYSELGMGSPGNVLLAFGIE